MQPGLHHQRLRGLDAPRGGEVRELAIGDWRIRLSGLDGALAACLDRRWAGFLAGGGAAPSVELETRRAGRPWMAPRPGEPYRIECGLDGGVPVVWSYNFAAAPVDGARWRAGLADSGDEPVERAVENLVRYMVARLAVLEGGFALHGAGVLRDGRAHVFAGGSGSGKSTAVALSTEARSLGDDFAVVVPLTDGVWVTTAVPFDNRERAPVDPPRGWLPLAGVWRLHQTTRARVEHPPAFLARASLTACVAFAWALPDLADDWLRQVERFVATGLYAHLHFRRAPDFWQRIDEVQRPV